MQFVEARLGGGTAEKEGAPAPEPPAPEPPVPPTPEPPKPEPKPEPEPKAVPKSEPKPEVKKPDIPKPEPEKKTKTADKTPEPKTKRAEPKEIAKKDPLEPDPLAPPPPARKSAHTTDSFMNAGDGTGWGIDPNASGAGRGPAVEGPRGTGITGVPGLLNAWAGLVQKKVLKVWQQPEGVRLDPEHNQTIVTFWVDRQGNLIGEPQVTRPADPLLDKSAVAAILAAAPLPPLPDDFPALEQQVEFAFTLSEAAGNPLQ